MEIVQGVLGDSGLFHMFGSCWRLHGVCTGTVKNKEFTFNVDISKLPCGLNPVPT